MADSVRFDDVANSGSSVHSVMDTDENDPVSEIAEFSVGGVSYKAAGGVTSNGYQVHQYKSSDLILVISTISQAPARVNYAY